MKKNILFKNIIILLFSGIVAKIIGMLSKIIFTRTVGIKIISLYTLITPTFMLLINICQFSFPISISKISAEEKYNNKIILKNAYLIGFIIDILLIIIINLLAPLIAYLLHNNDLTLAIKSIGLILPFVTISSIQRGFLHGKEDMTITSVSNILEEIIKIILIISIIPVFINTSNIKILTIIILLNIITELNSIIIMQIRIRKKYFNYNKGSISFSIIKEITSISLPTTLVRLISSTGFFLEPIILTTFLLKSGYSIKYITYEYGIINSYIIPLLSVPSFFSISIASALLPNITKLYSNKKYKDFNNKLIKLLFISMLVGLVSIVIILLFPKFILKTIYNVNYGINYLYTLAPFFLILYMQPTLSVGLQASGNTSKLFIVSIISMIIKYIILIILTYGGLGINSLLYSLIVGIIVTTGLLSYFNYKYIKK